MARHLKIIGVYTIKAFYLNRKFALLYNVLSMIDPDLDPVPWAPFLALGPPHALLGEAVVQMPDNIQLQQGPGPHTLTEVLDRQAGQLGLQVVLLRLLLHKGAHQAHLGIM